ncbi:hypothetical protein EDB85DRAFT_2159031 [Lactarius pseudohatsudake]|nr:hypothetical protein EDB85DRAFT_2159031 [Lactarius pseudohatsudake]
MPGRHVRPQQAGHLSAETTFPRPVVPHQPHGHVVQNAAVPLPAYGGQQQVHVHDDVPLPAENAAVQDLIQDAHRFPPPEYEAAYHQFHQDYPMAPYMQIQQDGRVAQGVPAHLQAVAHQENKMLLLPLVKLVKSGFADAPEVQENHDNIFGYAPADPAVGPPQYFPGPEPLHYQAPLVNAAPADGLRNLAGRYVNNPGTRVNMLRIEPGLAGHFEVWIVLEMAHIL